MEDGPQLGSILLTEGSSGATHAAGTPLHAAPRYMPAPLFTPPAASREGPVQAAPATDGVDIP
eukprot:2935993-Heterocapsa_arctica.AAC.1